MKKQNISLEDYTVLKRYSKASATIKELDGQRKGILEKVFANGTASTIYVAVHGDSASKNCVLEKQGSSNTSWSKLAKQYIAEHVIEKVKANFVTSYFRYAVKFG